MTDKLREMAQALRDYAPPEVLKDEFAYDRLLGNVHEFAGQFLAAIDESVSAERWLTPEMQAEIKEANRQLHASDPEVRCIRTTDGLIYVIGPLRPN